MKPFNFFKYILMINIMLATTNVYALENESSDETSAYSEFYDENEESPSVSDENEQLPPNLSNENKQPAPKICEKKCSCCRPLPNEDCYAFSFSKDTGPACCRKVFLHGEFLWFRAIEQGLDYATQQEQISSPTNFPLTHGDIVGFSTDSKQWEWRPGGRIGLGVYSNLEKWNFETIWTYVHLSDHSSKKINSGALLPLFLPPVTFDVHTILHSKAHWHGHFNTVDLMMGKPYHVSRCFISNPAFGFKAAFINQHLDIGYYLNEVKYNVYAKNNYWGVGLRGFYEGQFILGCGWSVYGKGAYSLLVGRFNISQKADQMSYTPPESTDYHTKNHFYDVQSNTELGFGICLNICNSCNQLTTIKLGYETHQWLEQNQLRKFFATMPNINDTISRGNLSFYGFMLELLFEF